MSDHSNADLTELLDIGRSSSSRILSSVRSVRGASGAVATGLSAAAEIGATGRVSRQTLLSTSSSAAIMVGARLVPGVGWAIMAYTAADIGSRAFLGKPFGETMVGKPIDWAVGQAGRASLAAASGLTDIVGWKSGSDFLNNVVKPWAFPGDERDPQRATDAGAGARSAIADARETGLLPKDPSIPLLIRGPTSTMTAHDTLEHPPRAAGFIPPGNLQHISVARDGPGAALTSIDPTPLAIENLRQTVLVQDAQSIANEGLDLSSPQASRETAKRTRTADILSAARAGMVENPGSAPNLPVRSQTRTQGAELDD